MNGPAKFRTIKINQAVEKKGAALNTPLLFTSLRECLRSYIMLAPLNIPDDVKPWAKSIHTPPIKPKPLTLKKTAIIIPI